MVRLYPKAKVHEGQLDSGNGPLDPVGITIHYTAGGTATSSISYLRTTNLRYHLIIGRDGTVYQMVPLDRKVYHAGKAVWENLSPNSHHIAVAIASWGKVDYEDGQYHSWAKQRLLPELVAYRPYSAKAGLAYWEKSSHAQENTLVDLIIWLIRECRIEPRNICGHDECAPERRIDPGGCLSFTLPDLRSSAESFLGISSAN